MTSRLAIDTVGMPRTRDATRTWLPEFACPECGDPVRPDGPAGFVCRRCVMRFERRNGVYNFLTPSRADAAASFLRQYRLVRASEGFRRSAADYYQNLPTVPPGDPHAAEWRVRRQSYAHLRYHGLRPMMRGPIRVLDLGAGNAWLSHRLASLGHRVIAVDLQDDEMDGLGVCHHYDVTFMAVRADFDALPFAPGQFDLAVFEGSLHYSPDPVATLVRAGRMLAPGGVLAVMDSPMFTRERDGHAMVDRQARQMELEHGLTNVVHPGTGFLTFAALERAAGLLGISGRFYRSRGPLGWRLHRQLAWLRLRRAPAAFGVWVAQ